MMSTKIFSFTLFIFVLAACASKKTPAPVAEVSKAPVATEEIEKMDKIFPPKALAWNYREAGPAQWASIDPNYVMCGKGLEQSPVELRWSKPLVARKISFFYGPGVFQIESHPQKLQLTFAKGSTAEIEGKKWKLVAMQLHTPAEHSFSKKTFPLEAHLVHYDEEETRLGVIAVVFQVGKPNMGIETLLKNLPSESPGKVLVENEPLNPSLFLPLSSTHYTYPGSITTPPCTEGVTWNVLNTPVEISAAQLEALQKKLGPNARPTQKWNHRKPLNYN